ncbi:hypothetical protein WJX73_010554 [Symbiochloris irregularis]|uniref:glycerophosphodiester phosphodiesterase n=1 Tax=Symbiochloris irregularis TaxID=706552 RepID=A0AAW1NT35_9CHLO
MASKELKEPLTAAHAISTLPAPWDQAKPGRPMVMSHRAGGNEAPENTLAALRCAEAAGSRVMQMDVLQTADGTPVVFHDISLKRATGVDKDIRQVPTAELPLYKEYLDPLIGLPGTLPIHTTEFKDGRRIETLAELLEAAGPDTYLQLEFWDENQTLIEREALPEAPRILPMSEVYQLYFKWFTGRLKPPPTGTVLNIPLFTGWESDFIKKIRLPWYKKVVFVARLLFMKWLLPRPKLFKWLNAHGIPVLVFILNRPQDWEAALKLSGITAIMTDSPKALEKYLADREA